LVVTMLRNQLKNGGIKISFGTTTIIDLINQKDKSYEN